MTPYIVGWAVLLFANMPIAFTLGVIAVIFIWMTDGPFVVVPQRLVAGLDSFPLLAVPAFVVAGEIMNAGGITRRLFRFTQACVGHITGGLGHVNVMANVIVSGISGSAIAEAISIGTLIIKAMKDEGYEGKFAAALTAAACTIGPLIPPSIPLVIYAVIASASVGKLLIAGFIPGFLVAIVLMVYVYFYAKRRGLKPAPRMTWRELGAATREAFWALLTPFIMIGGIIAGWFTATEAAATTAVLFAARLDVHLPGDLVARPAAHPARLGDDHGDGRLHRRDLDPGQLRAGARARTAGARRGAARVLG
jgi:tripartite ATP-independent transporter DctM subunit